MKKILLAEDDMMNREMIARYLTLQDYYVVTVADGANAVLAARREQPDLILLDMGLPILNGWQTARRLKSLPETTNIPIVALTAFVMSEDRDRCFAAGCNAFESKPVNFERLLKLISAMLHRHEDSFSLSTA